MAALRPILREFIGKPVQLPTGIGKQFSETKQRAPYLVSCLGKQAVLYVSPRFADITGYPCGKFITEGLQFWFSIIHPADMQGVVSAITKAQHDLVTDNPHPTKPLQLEYRITSKGGRLVWIRELKYIVSYQDGKKNHILGCLEDITAKKEVQQTVVRDVLRKERAGNGLLDVAVSYQLEPPSNRREPALRGSHRISAREKQVLRLVAAGNSSKQIAAELSISENTVETHRRHLLQKFQVSNSTALVKEAHRLCLV